MGCYNTRLTTLTLKKTPTYREKSLRLFGTFEEKGGLRLLFKAKYGNILYIKQNVRVGLLNSYMRH